MPFVPGTLTASQAAELNQLQRDVRSLMTMTGTGITINRAAGCVNLSVTPSETLDPEFDAMVIDGRYPNGVQAVVENPGTRYSWVKVVWAPPPGPGSGAVPNLDWSTMGTLNLFRNRSNSQPANPPATKAIPNGQFVRIKAMPADSQWYTTDAVGGVGSVGIGYKDWAGNNALILIHARDLIWYTSGTALDPVPPPITPPPGTVIPPAPDTGGGGV